MVFLKFQIKNNFHLPSSFHSQGHMNQLRQVVFSDLAAEVLGLGTLGCLRSLWQAEQLRQVNKVVVSEAGADQAQVARGVVAGTELLQHFVRQVADVVAWGVKRTGKAVPECGTMDHVDDFYEK